VGIKLIMKDKIAIAIVSSIIACSVIFAITSIPEPEQVSKKTWYATPLHPFTCMSNAEGDSELIKISADNCGSCVGISKNLAGGQLAQRDDRWQIDEGFIEIDYSLCDDYVSPTPIYGKQE
jgi:hypothetical protein